MCIEEFDNCTTPEFDRQSSATNCPCGLPDYEDNMIAYENPNCDVAIGCITYVSCVGLDQLENKDLENLDWFCPACEGMHVNVIYASYFSCPVPVIILFSNFCLVCSLNVCRVNFNEVFCGNYINYLLQELFSIFQLKNFFV